MRPRQSTTQSSNGFAGRAAEIAIVPGGISPAFRPGVEVNGQPFQRSRFARHLLVFSLANLISLLCNGVLAFLLPRWLSIESYGYYRLFALYSGFGGVLHFGLLDGALLRWAAFSQRRLRSEMRPTLVFLLWQQASLLLPATAVLAAWAHHRPGFFVVLATLGYALVWNVAVLGQFAMQADKSFELLSAITLIPSTMLLGIVLALRHWHGLTLPFLLGASCGVWVVAAVPLWGILLDRYPRKSKGVAHLWQIGLYNVRAGWGVLLATVVTILALSSDRIAVSLSFGIRDFAVYSLAATALAVLNTIMLSVSRVVFPYLSGEDLSPQQRLRAYTWGESCLVTLWAISLAGYFPLRSLIGWYLPAYGRSLPILRLLMLATGLTAVIYILHANYFRSGLRQGRLLVGACVGLLSAVLFLVLARQSGSLPNMAWAMVAAIGLWWGADELLLRELTKKTALETGKTLIFTLACGGSFLLCAANRNPGRGFVSYSCMAALLITLIYGRALRSLPLPKLFAPWSADSA